MSALAPLAPARPQPQHLRALERANAVRLARAELKRRVGNGSLSAAEVILDVPPEAATMSVSELLLSQRRWGETRCRKFLQGCELSETKVLGSLTERQRQTLAASLENGGRPAPVSSGLQLMPFARI
jgi:hypothetical protein